MNVESIKMQNGNIQLLFIRIEQSVQIQALSASSTMNKSIIRFLTLLVLKIEDGKVGPYFHPTMINLQIISSNHQTGIKSYKIGRYNKVERERIGTDRRQRPARGRTAP